LGKLKFFKPELVQGNISGAGQFEPQLVFGAELLSIFSLLSHDPSPGVA